MLSYHNFNEHETTGLFIEKIRSGTQAALISDGGTPGISDPGYLLIREAIEQAITIECLPGPVAFVPALVCSGLPMNKFHFEGFLPHKKGRQTRLKSLAQYPHTIIVYESPFRVVKLLEEIIQFFGNRRLCLSREISKIHEEHLRGTAETLITHFKNKTPKGEFVFVIEGPVKEKDGSHEEY